jgi:uncharacterized protein YehS (DUF1456 family)
MTNNEILKKLKIAFSMKDTDVLSAINSTGLNLSKSEINAFFQAREHKNYKDCGDQVLRRFLDGIITKQRS